MSIRETGMLGEAPKLKKIEKRSVSGQKIASPVYKKSTVDETYNELTASFKGNYSVIFRCYNQGVAYRFVTDLKSGQIIVDNEKAVYNFPKQAKGYAAYSNRGKDGNIESQFLNSFENTYDHQPLPSLNSQRLITLPFLAEIPGSNTKVCITESDLYDYPGMFLRSNVDNSSMQGVYATAPKVTEQGGHNLLQKMVKERHDYIAKTDGKRSFPWRIFAISEMIRNYWTMTWYFYSASRLRCPTCHGLNREKWLGTGGMTGIFQVWISAQESTMIPTNIILILPPKTN